MILFVSSSPRALECMRTIEEATCRRTVLAPDTASASTLARTGEFRIVVLDEAGAADNASDAAAIARNCGNAITIGVNTALSGAGRIADEVRAGALRLDAERSVAIREAMAAAHREIRNEITAILLAADLALSVTGLPGTAMNRLREIRKLATRMRRHFEVT